MIKVKPECVKEGFSKPKPTSKLLKLILSVLFFVFFMDFGLIKYKSFKIKIIAKITTILFAFLITFILLFFYVPFESNYFYWYTKYILEYNVYILILLSTPESKSFYTFLTHLHSIDVKLGHDSNFYRLDTKILLYWIGSIGYKTITTTVYCSIFDECIKPIWVHLLFFFPYLPLDIHMILFFFIFNAAHNRLAVLRKFIESSQCEAAYFQSLYKSLIDATETVKQAFVSIFVVTLIAEIPFFLAVIYEIIKEITHGSKNVAGYFIECLVVTSLFIVMFAPAVAAGSLSSEVNKIKIYLHNILLENKGPQQERDIQKFINYIDARPFKFTVLGLIPMDATLPMIVLNLSITYIIILLQLTHLY